MCVFRVLKVFDRALGIFLSLEDQLGFHFQLQWGVQLRATRPNYWSVSSQQVVLTALLCSCAACQAPSVAGNMAALLLKPAVV